MPDDDDDAAADETGPGDYDGADIYIDDEAAAKPAPSNRHSSHLPVPPNGSGACKTCTQWNNKGKHSVGYFQVSNQRFYHAVSVPLQRAEALPVEKQGSTKLPWAQVMYIVRQRHGEDGTDLWTGFQCLLQKRGAYSLF